MGACCCAVKAIDPQFYVDLVRALDAYRASGTAAIVDESGELLALRGGDERTPLLISLIPAVLRASSALGLSLLPSPHQVASTVLRGKDWLCLISMLPQSYATVILLIPHSEHTEANQDRLNAIDQCTVDLKRDIARAEAVLRARK